MVAFECLMLGAHPGEPYKNRGLLRNVHSQAVSVCAIFMLYRSESVCHQKLVREKAAISQDKNNATFSLRTSQSWDHLSSLFHDKKKKKKGSERIQPADRISCETTL